MPLVTFRRCRRTHAEHNESVRVTRWRAIGSITVGKAVFPLPAAVQPFMRKQAIPPLEPDLVLRVVASDNERRWLWVSDVDSCFG